MYRQISSVRVELLFDLFITGFILMLHMVTIWEIQILILVIAMSAAVTDLKSLHQLVPEKTMSMKK